MTGDISVGELARAVQNVLLRLDGVTTRLESGQFVRTDVYTLQQTSTEKELSDLGKNKVSLEAHNELKARVAKLEEANVWLVRLVIAFVVVGVLTLVFTQGGGAK